MPGGTIKDCLGAIGLTLSGLSGCASLKEEWALIKKAYFKKILVTHPDKGGSATVFRDVQATFEVLRELFDTSAIESFATAGDQSTADSFAGTKEDLRGMKTPSWEYYAEAAKEVAPTYRVELARSGRSRCQARGSGKQCSQDPPFIEKGNLRIGFMLESGGYGLWVHLQCWRVPSKVWLGLPDPAKCRDRNKFQAALLRMNQVTLSGVGDLEKAQRKQVVSHVMDKRHWTFGGAVEKVKKTTATGDGRSRADEEETAMGSSASTDLSLVVAGPKRERFVVPVPGKGAPAGSLAGKTLVLTGVFPEVGGGEGLQLGKARARKMIESFGGKVASSVSGRTDVLVVGKDPGFSKVSKARKNPKTRLLSLHDMKISLQQGSLEAVKEKKMAIKDFSKGFAQRRGGPNGLARRASKAELAIASGKAAPALQNATRKRPAAARGPVAKARRLRDKA